MKIVIYVILLLHKMKKVGLLKDMKDWFSDIQATTANVSRKEVRH